MLNKINELFLKTEDGVKIAINHHKIGHKNVLIIAHGWFMTKDSKYYADMAKIFSENYDIISMDFRGHGRSSGFYTFTSKEPMDLKAVVNYAKEQYSKIYLIGFSLGGALALIHESIEKNIDKIIVVSAPHSFMKIENQMWRKEAWSHSLKKFEFLQWIKIRPSLIIGKKIRPIDIINKVEAPTLFLAGEKDVTVHAWHTKTLFKNAKCRKHFELFKGCCHAEDLFYQEKEKFINLCNQWLKDKTKVENKEIYSDSVSKKQTADKPELILLK